MKKELKKNLEKKINVIKIMLVEFLSYKVKILICKKSLENRVMGILMNYLMKLKEIMLKDIILIIMLINGKNLMVKYLFVFNYIKIYLIA